MMNPAHLLHWFGETSLQASWMQKLKNDVLGNNQS